MPFDIDVAGATEAIENAGGIDNLMQAEMGTQRNPDTVNADMATPASQGDQGATQDAQTPTRVRDEAGRFARAEQLAAEQAQGTEPSVEDTFSTVDPNTLPPELQAIYKSLQADYTRKTQTLAEARRELEAYGDPSEIEQAVQLYESLQNPQAWPQLYEELKTELQKMGYSDAQASQAAAQEVQAQQQATQGPIDFTNISDPELQPFAEAYKQLQGEVDRMKSELTADREKERQVQLQQSLIGELQRQENLIRQENPSYTDDDVNAIYELASYHNGNLIQAQQRYEDIVTGHLARYVASKQGAAQGSQPLPGGGTQTTEPQTFGNLDEAHAAAMEHIRHLDALG